MYRQSVAGSRITDFIVYARQISVANIRHLMFDGRFEVALDSETLGTKTLCLFLITTFAIFIFANYSENKVLNLSFCGPCIVIYLCNKDQQDALFSLNLFR